MSPEINPDDAPGYWMFEQSGVLKPVILAYLHGDHLSQDEIRIMRDYLRQWIMAPGFQGEEIDELRHRVETFPATRQGIAGWIRDAVRAGCDPL